MRAYVSIRGSRSPRSVHRDASPQPLYTKRGTSAPLPYASLSIGHPNGTATTFELTYVAMACSRCASETSRNHCPMCDGSGFIKQVFLTRKRSDETSKQVYETEVFD